MSIGTSSLSGLSTGISKFSNMTKMVTETLVSSSADGEKKAKDEKKAQLALAVQMLEDISLQSPSTHLGLVLAYTGRNSSPVIHPGLKFTWFRMQGQDHIDQVEESQRAWYAPSVDDINCTICVQCEDNFGQGLSRYLEVIAEECLILSMVYALNPGYDFVLDREHEVWATAKRSVASIRCGVLDQQRFLRGKTHYDNACRPG